MSLAVRLLVRSARACNLGSNLVRELVSAAAGKPLIMITRAHVKLLQHQPFKNAQSAPATLHLEDGKHLSLCLRCEAALPACQAGHASMMLQRQVPALRHLAPPASLAALVGMHKNFLAFDAIREHLPHLPLRSNKLLHMLCIAWSSYHSRRIDAQEVTRLQKRCIQAKMCMQCVQ